MREISSRKTWVDAFDKVARSAEDVQVMIEMAEEEDDSDIAREAENDAEKLCAAVEDLEFRNMLSGESDQKMLF